MKFLIFISSLIPFAAVGQTTSDYENILSKFQAFYNAGLGDSINAMYGHGWDQMKATTPLWTNKENTLRLKEFGTLNSFRFIGIDNSDPNKVYVFETFFSKAGRKTTSLTLDKDLGIDTFRFITTSEGITQLLKKHQR